MALTAARYVATNTTNIDVLRRSQAFYLAVRIPLDTPRTDGYPTIAYPLQKPPQADAEGEGPESARDRRATRLFAILRGEPRENPWDLGFRGNWRSVMGNNPAEWLLPIRHSPCCDHESMRSDYQLGRLLADLRARYAVPDLDAEAPRPTAMVEAGAPL